MSFNSPFFQFFDTINQDVDQFNRLLNSSGFYGPRQIKDSTAVDSNQITKKTPETTIGSLARDPWFSDFGKDLIPPLDILDHENEYQVHVSVPGIKDKNSINLEYHHDTNEVVVSGEIPDIVTEETRGSAKVRERSYGSFKRVFKLPTTPSVDPENIKANYVNGVLELTIPKLKPTAEETAKVKKIDIGDENSKL